MYQMISFFIDASREEQGLGRWERGMRTLRDDAFPARFGPGFIPLSALRFDQLSGQAIKEMHDKAAALIPMLHPHDFARQSCCLSQRNQATDMQHIGTAVASAELAWLGSS
ncbi:unnamed protein product [Sphagnum jensenii]|jgi:hypothetical protein|uniref:Uncharacterized protein n=1 Tax=Sphagnum jensenii TaxID=128206 RepID=A0ABP0XE89_9BRYO